MDEGEHDFCDMTHTTQVRRRMPTKSWLSDREKKRDRANAYPRDVSPPNRKGEGAKRLDKKARGYCYILG